MQFPHQVDMKNDVKCWKDVLWYYTTLETHRVYPFTHLAKNAMQDHRLKPNHDPMMDRKQSHLFFMPMRAQSHTLGFLVLVGHRHPDP